MRRVVSSQLSFASRRYPTLQRIFSLAYVMLLFSFTCHNAVIALKSFQSAMTEQLLVNEYTCLKLLNMP